MEMAMNAKGNSVVLTSRFLLIACILTGMPAMALACCPDDGQGAPKTVGTTGLGDANPPGVDLAKDTYWRVYEFERDGIRYFQINDATGKVRAATGRIADTFWVMPIGSDADRVYLPQDALPSGRVRVLYQGRDVEIVLIEGEARPRWIVRARSTR
jgi:hypothetical protein